jgi:uncharacterized membrane protein YedE/YeeE
MKNFISFSVGLIFALGLGYGGMTQTHLVRAFLDIFGSWNPALIGVMAGAIAVHALVYQFVKHRTSPLLDTKFHLPTRKDIDKRLLLGAALFGLGWGWAGICPGPGIVALMSGDKHIIIFILSMLVGMSLFQKFERKIKL